MDMNPQISFFDPNGTVPTINWGVAAGAVGSIAAGTPTKFDSSGNVVPMVDGDGTTSQRFTGIAKGTSSDTVAAAGSVDTFMPLPGHMLKAKAKSAAAANTQAEIDALRGKRVVFDLTSAVWTIDTAAGDAATNCVVITGGEYQTSTIYFVYSPSGTFFDTR